MANKELLAALTGIDVSPSDTSAGTGLQALAINSRKFYNPYMSTRQSAATALGTGLASALLGHLARIDADQQNAEIRPLLAKALTVKTPDEVGAILASEHGDKLKNIALQSYLTNVEREQKIAQDRLDARQSMALAFAKEGIPTEAAKEILGEDPFLLQNEMAVRAEQAEKKAAFGKPVEPKLFEGETLDEKRNRYIEQGKRMGMTANKASDDADRRLAVEKQSNKAIETKIQDARAKASTVSNLAAVATESVAGAGSTGGPALYAGGRELASSLYQYLPTEGGRTEAQQRASTRVLDSIKPEIVKAGRSPGSVTDFENKLLIGAGPSSDKTPEENKALIKGMEERAQLDSDYADFLESYLNQKGTSIGADKLWNEYKKAEVFPKGRLNPERTSWQEYLGAKRGVVPSADTSAEKAALIAQIKAAIAAKQGK